MKVCFLISHIPNPRIRRRIELVKKYADVFLIYVNRVNQSYFEKTDYGVKSFEIPLDLPDSKQIFRRAVKFNEYKNRAKQLILDIKPDVIYTELYDSLKISVYMKKYLKNLKIIYEIPDIRELFIQNQKQIAKIIVQKYLISSEKKLLKSVDKLILTSEMYYEKYYKFLINKNKVIFIPNLPDPSLFNSYNKKKEGKFTIGFVGGLRYIDQLKLLIDVGKTEDIDIIFSGGASSKAEMKELLDYSKGYSNIYFTGPFEYKSEIASIYSKLDCVYSVYDADNNNVKIALPNKLYEAILCEMPIIVAKNTYLSELVEKWGVGISVDHRSKDDLKDKINLLKNNIQLLLKIKKNCSLIKKSFTDKNYNDELEKFLKNLININNN